MNAGRRALLMSGGAVALGPLAGCSSLVRDPLVPDSCATGSTTPARPTRRRARRIRHDAADCSERNSACRRSSTTSSGAPSTSSGTPATRSTGWCPTAVRPVALRASPRSASRSPRTRSASSAAASRATQARERTLTTLRFFRDAPQGPQARGMTGYKGFFYHFLDMKTGHARLAAASCRPSTPRCCSPACCTAQTYFDARRIPTRSRSARRSTRSTAASTGSGRRCAAPLDQHGLAPGERASSPYDWRGYNEAMLVYCWRSARRRTRSAPSAWSAWTESYRRAWGTLHGQEHLSFAPLFGHQYSHVWIDFRGIQDATCASAASTTSRTRAARRYAQRAYAIANPKGWFELRRERLGLHRVRRPGRAARVRPQRPLRATSSTTRRAAPAARHASTTARSRRPRPLSRCRSRPRSSIPALEEMHARYGEYIYSQLRLPRRVQPQLRPRPTSSSARPHRSRRSAGSPATTSASTRARSSR